MLCTPDLRDIRFEGVDPVARKDTRRGSRPGGVPLEAGRRAVVAPGDAAEPAHDALLTLVLERAGLDPQDYRPRALRRRSAACVRHLRVAGPDEARAAVEFDPTVLEGALSSVLIGTSEFFRDTSVWEAISRLVLPALLQTQRGLRVCSVGASAGQELHSVAMLLTECCALAHSELIGIDCRQDAVRTATRGWYYDITGVSESRRREFFEPVAGGWQVHDALRGRTAWQRDDLFRFTLAAPVDLLLFRNVAIYLDAERAEAAWKRLAAHLKPGGFLIAGKAERPPARLGLTRIGACIYRKP